MYQSLLTETSERICTITINRPDKLNALNKTVIKELGQVIDSINNDPAIGGAIITGAGPKSFVAGADISEFLTLDPATGTELAQLGQDNVFTKIEYSSKPFIAAVNGFALGGGCELAMACHIRMASQNAKFGQPEVNLGLIPGYGGTQRLAQLVGKGKALELIMSANMIDATEAHRIGLVNHVVSPETLIEESRKLLLTILSKGPGAVGKVIEAINALYDNNKNGFAEEIRLFGECFGTAEMKEGVTAFLEKRKAQF
ncbi:MAG: enoyl-CoA hydratase-related protein [Chitinophagaceae bacterium]|nr:enoyl-CoA hydratase-related protein [Chitinophagaceae bacterium]